MICWIINNLLCLLYKKEYTKYIHCSDIQKTQEDKLQDILRNNEHTLYGTRYGFNKIHNAEEYQKIVPLTQYEDYLPYIEQIKNGEKNILTAEDVTLLELTSGSTSATKLIPYTKGLKEEFQAGIRPWLYSLYNTYPQIKNGTSYWSITPVTHERTYTKGNIPIGFEDDSEYFGTIEKYLMHKVLASPKDIQHEKDMETFYFKTASKLLASHNLTLISVWSPSFLLLLLSYMQKNKERLLQSLSVKRHKEIETPLTEQAYCKVWKKLTVISCWGDGHAASYLKEIQALFKDVIIQAKGLLATEGFVSFPLLHDNGSRISYFSHFFEFIESETEKVYLAHALEKDKSYEIVLTTSGGLYRYRIGDMIRVIDRQGAHPLIQFIGRKGIVSDLFGEKLSEAFVQQVYEKLGEGIEYFMLAPEKDRYILYLKTEKVIENASLENTMLDTLLRENFHYDYCRKLGQLQEAAVFKLTGDPAQEYTQHCLRKGQRLGDIKLQTLSLDGGWEKVYTGYAQKGKR